MENNFDYLQQSSIRPEVKEIEKQIRVKSPYADISMQGGNPNAVPSVMGVINSGVDTRQQAIDYSTPFLDVYKPLSSGEYVSQYETYMSGVDNMERLAQQQTTGEKWSNGVLKALSKTGNAVVGGTAGLVYGLGAALTEGSFSAIYDNDFSNKLNDWDTTLNYQLPNYYTKQEQEKGLGGQLGTANFWADKFLGGLSFTAGAIISEAIWAAATGGTSLAARGAMLGTKAARWGAEAIGETAVLSGMSKYTSMLKNLGTSAYKVGEVSKALPNLLGKTGEVLSVTGQLARSAGYEASVEALQFKKEAEENFYNNFADLNGREPNADDIAKFNTELEGTANGVFGTNMAILMPSNLITLGHVLDIKNPIKTGLTEFIDKKAFGYGLAKTAEGAFTRLAPTTTQKVTRGIFNYAVKPGVTEGIFEEGLQGVTTKVGNRWMENTYDPKNTAQTFDSIDAISKSMAEQYGTKEGIVEVGLGVLIGMFGGAANVKGEQSQKEKELDFKASVANEFGDKNLFAKNLINSKIQTANRIIGFSEDAKAEEAKGNVVGSQLAKNSAMLSFINAKQILGESVASTTEEVKNSLDTLTNEQWAEAGIAPENIETEKAERISEFESLAKQWKTNKTYWQYMLGGRLAGEQNLEVTGLEKAMGGVFSKNAAIVEALTWQSTIGENAHTMMRDAQEIIGKEVGVEHTKTINTIGKLKELHSEIGVNIDSLQKEYKANLAEREALTKKIVKLNNAPKETEGNKVQGQQLADTQQRLLEVQENITAIERESQVVAEKINATDVYRQNLENIDVNQNLAATLISGSDLLKLNENIEKFKGALDFVKTTNPQRAQYLEDMMKEYGDAENVFLQHQATQRVLADKDFKIERIEGWLRGKVKAKKAMNENTQEWLQDALKTYSENKAAFLDDLLSAEEQRTTVSDAEFKEFQETTNISAETLVKIAEKVKKQEPLDAKENAIYKDREKEVKEIISKSNTKTQPKSDDVVPVETRTNLEIYRDVLNKMLTKMQGINHMPATEAEALTTKPTEADIEKYRELHKNKQTKSTEYKELENKLKSWKLLSSAVDENYTSIAEIISIIEQHETETQQEDTKAEVTEDEAKTVLRDDTETGGKRYSPEYLQNQLGNATVKNVKDSGKYSFSHIKLDYIINQLNADYTVTRKGKEISSDLEKLQIGDVVYVDGMPITCLAGGVLEMDINDFNSRQQVLNMYVSPVRTGTWTYLDVYTVKGNEMVKMPSQFTENIKPDEIYNQKEGDTLTAHIDDTDGWNKTSKGDNPEQLKIYFKDSKGNNLSVAKAGREAKNDASVIEYMEMRQVAYDRWVAAGKPEKLDLGITAKIDNIFFGSAELITDENGKILNVPITQEEVENVIIGKGYIQNGEFKLDTELKDVNATFVGKLSKDNPTLKVPVIVFKKGVHTIAFPITMAKTNTPVEFDSILNSGKSPQEIVLAINDAIIKNNLDTPKLVYADINNEEKLNITREAFASKQSYVSADVLASNTYKKSNLVNDALINIDLSNLDSAISSPKIRIDLDSIELGNIKDFKNETKTEIENSLNDVAKEIEKFNNTQYLDKKGEAVENEFTDFIGENPTVEATNQLNKIKNVNILRGYLSLAPKSFRTLFGEDKIKAAKNAILRYDSISRQTSPKEGDKKSGKKASNCK